MATSPANIYLTGFSYTGKSTVSRVLAERLGMDFVDTDDEIEATYGDTVPAIFASQGEAAFREMESGVLRAVAERRGLIVATGGGAILDPENRRAMARSGAVVCLEAYPETILRRMHDEAHNQAGKGTTERPLLSTANPLAQINSLKRSRQPAYAVADWTVNTDSLTIDAVADEAARGAEIGQQRLSAGLALEAPQIGNDSDVAWQVQTETAAYPIVVGQDALETLGERMKDLGLRGRAFVITEPGIPHTLRTAALESLATVGFDPTVIEFPGGETSKTVDQANKIYAALGDNQAERRDVIVALGGGVTGDLAGLVAATWLRGVDFVQAPTSLLAMVDASIGGKVAVDLPHGKNLVGVFYQPRLVLADTHALDTLPSRDLTAGWAEVIKTAAILDADLFDFLEERAGELIEGDEELLAQAVRRCAAIKGRVVSLDERETSGLRALLNLGHTLGHALESATNYTGLLHGEAVAIGMSFAAMLAGKCGALAPQDRDRQIQLLTTFGLPTTPPPNIDVSLVRAALSHDKKVLAGQTRWILCDRIGHGRLRADVPQSVVDEALDSFLSGASSATT